MWLETCLLYFFVFFVKKILIWVRGGRAGAVLCLLVFFSAEDGVGKTRPDQEAKVLLTHEEILQCSVYDPRRAAL